MKKILYIAVSVLLMSCGASRTPREAVVPDADSLTWAEADSISGHEYMIAVDTLTDALMAQWQAVSEEYGRLHSNPIVDSLFRAVLDYYNPEKSTPYVVLPYWVSVRVHRQALDVSSDDEFAQWRAYECCTRDSNLLCSVNYIPHIECDRPVLYDLPNIHDRLSHYLGGMDDTEDINDSRVEALRRYISVAYGHWGGYWHLKTMPIIYSLDLFPSGVAAEVRTSWCTGEVVYMAYDSDEWILLTDWIE